MWCLDIGYVGAKVLLGHTQSIAIVVKSDITVEFDITETVRVFHHHGKFLIFLFALLHFLFQLPSDTSLFIFYFLGSGCFGGIPHITENFEISCFYDRRVFYDYKVG